MSPDAVIGWVLTIAAGLRLSQAKTLAEDRGIRCVTLDYDTLRGIESDEFRLF